MAKDPREYGYEGEMVMSQLKGIMSHAEQLHGRLKPDTDLPEWVQSKITLAYDYMQTAADYMSTEMSEEVKAGKAYKVPVKPAQAWPGGKVYKQKPVDSKKLDAVGKKIGAIRGVKEEAQLDEISYRDSGAKNMLRASMKADRIAAKDRARREKIELKIAKRGVKEEAQLDELSKDTLKSYVNKADARTMDRVIDDPKARRKAQNRTFGIEKAVKKIQEDGAVNAAGAGNVAGLGVGPQGEPGRSAKLMKKPLKRFKRFTGK